MTRQKWFVTQVFVLAALGLLIVGTLASLPAKL